METVHMEIHCEYFNCYAVKEIQANCIRHKSNGAGGQVIKHD